jgi:hypothetical protein
MQPKKDKRPAEQKTAGIGSLLDEAEGRSAPRKPKRSADDLDLDGAWSKS